MMSSILFRTATRLILPLALLFAAYMCFKGHNAPGGGFIGGLIAAVAFMLYGMANGRDALIELLPVHPRLLLAAGFGIALATAGAPLLFGYPLLRSFEVDAFPIGFGETIHLVTAFFFDIGVTLVVIGASTGVIQRLGDELPVDTTEAEEEARAGAAAEAEARAQARAEADERARALAEAEARGGSATAPGAEAEGGARP